MNKISKFLFFVILFCIFCNLEAHATREIYPVSKSELMQIVSNLTDKDEVLIFVKPSVDGDSSIDPVLHECFVCGGKGGFNSWGDPSAVNHKTVCPACKGDCHIKIYKGLQICKTCEGKGGFNSWGDPSAVNHRTVCPACKGNCFFDEHEMK